MARDGQIFMKVALELIARWSLDIEVRYLYCSRESLLLPSYQKTGDFELHWITWGYASTISIAEICRRLGITAEELHPFLVDSGLAKYLSDSERPVERGDMQNIYDLLRDDGFEKLLREKSEPLFRVTLSYLEQELFFDGVPSVVADTGWRGSSQYALSALIDKGGKRPGTGMKGYYLGLNREVHLFDNDTMHSFLFDWRTTPRDYQLYYFICFEMLLSANHGRTLGYQNQNGGAIIPVLGPTPGHHVNNIVEIHHLKTVEYARKAADNIPFEAFDDSLSEVARMLARAFINTPTTKEAELYGEWPIASEMGEADFQPISPPMSFGQFVRCAAGIDKIRGFWPQASLVRGKQRFLCWAYNRFLALGILDWYRSLLLRY